MRIINNFNSLLTLIEELAPSATSIDIASFGLWAGIYANGYSVVEKYKIRAYKTLETLSLHHRVRMLIGKPELISCEPNCIACKRKHTEQVRRIKTTLDRVEIDHRIIDGSHAKFYLFRSSARDVIIGGMNYTGSSWSDYMFHIQDRNLYDSLYKDFMSCWRKGT